MTINLALFLSPERIALAHRQDAGHWAILGETAFGASDMEAKLAGMRADAAKRVGEKCECLFILPDDQILYSLIDHPLDEDLNSRDIESQLTRITPYAVDDLEYTYQRIADGHVAIATVAKDTLQEARQFAQTHGFGDAAFGATPAANTGLKDVLIFGTLPDQHWPEFIYGADDWAADKTQDAANDGVDTQHALQNTNTDPKDQTPPPPAPASWRRGMVQTGLGVIGLVIGIGVIWAVAFMPQDTALPQNQTANTTTDALMPPSNITQQGDDRAQAQNQNQTTPSHNTPLGDQDFTTVLAAIDLPIAHDDQLVSALPSSFGAPLTVNNLVPASFADVSFARPNLLDAPRVVPQNVTESIEEQFIAPIGDVAVIFGAPPIIARPRPDAIVQRAAAVEPPITIEELSQIQPRQRPDFSPELIELQLSNIGPIIRPQQRPSYIAARQGGGIPAAIANRPNIPSVASVARAATEANVIRLNTISLIGVTGSASQRYATVRLSSGRFVRVGVGDRLHRGRVTQITENSVTYVRNGNTNTLSMPN